MYCSASASVVKMAAHLYAGISCCPISMQVAAQTQEPEIIGDMNDAQGMLIFNERIGRVNGDFCCRGAWERYAVLVVEAVGSRC